MPTARLHFRVLVWFTPSGRLQHTVASSACPRRSHSALVEFPPPHVTQRQPFPLPLAAGVIAMPPVAADQAGDSPAKSHTKATLVQVCYLRLDFLVRYHRDDGSPY